MLNVTKEYAIEKMTAINNFALFNGISLLVRVNPRIKNGVINKITVISKSNADAVKIAFPEFDINIDERKAKYAELVINYE